MASLVLIYANLFMVFAMFYNISHAANAPPLKTFDVVSYGAVDDGKTDNSKAFLHAWGDACQWDGDSWINITKGTYMLYPIVFEGPCKQNTGVLIRGTLLAPSDPATFVSDHWINFRHVDRLVVKGWGVLDGQGPSAWPYNKCKHNHPCKPLPTTMRFDFVTNSTVEYLKSINSKQVHFNIFGCSNMYLNHLSLSCPGDSPNTDGIHIGKSTDIKIENCVIGTGDDCIAMVTGAQNINISNVFCGPGHGISVGSLGKQENDNVNGVTVRNCTFKGSQNGVRIKTWAASKPGSASNLVFENINMQSVENPIIVDQNYCPQGSCNDKDQSAVEIHNVTLRNIYGTSKSEVAVNIKCSKDVPCKDFELENINLESDQEGKVAIAECLNVSGESTGTMQPSGCL